eukprot:scaffold477457_cov22-Prasinocladus_malaysianus.AAC.1
MATDDATHDSQPRLPIYIQYLARAGMWATHSFNGSKRLRVTTDQTVEVAFMSVAIHQGQHNVRARSKAIKALMVGARGPENGDAAGSLWLVASHWVQFALVAPHIPRQCCLALWKRYGRVK